MVGLTQNHLLKFEKFMHTHQTFRVFPMTPRLSPKARRERNKFLRKFFAWNDFIHKITHRGDLSRPRKVGIILCLVEVFFSLWQIASSKKYFFAHQRWRQKWSKTLTREFIQNKLPNGHRKKHPVAFQKIPTETGDFCATLKIKHIKRNHELNMFF